VKRYVLDAAKPFIVNLTHHGAERTESIDDPMMTVTGAHRGEKALAVPFVTGVGGRMGQTEPRGADQPAQTLTAKADSVIATPFLTKFRANSVGSGMDEPAPTVTANSFIKRAGGSAPIGVVAPHVMTMRNAQKPFNGADEPTHTITSGGAHMHLVAAFMAKHFGGHETPGWPMEKPISTVTAADHHAIVAGYLNRQFGTAVGSSLNEPTRTVMTDGAGGKTGLTAAFMQKYYGTDQDPQIEEPLHTATTKDRFGLCTVNIDGEPYVITDIGMRMLSPRELFRAQGFDDSYIIDRGADGKAITKTDQVSKCGNSVCPPMAKALVEANFQPMEIDAPDNHEFLLEAAE
jgi:DNA (cytosine-5)-methyltransferase 1